MVCLSTYLDRDVSGTCSLGKEDSELSSLQSTNTFPPDTLVINFKKLRNFGYLPFSFRYFSQITDKILRYEKFECVCVTIFERGVIYFVKYK